MNIFKNDREGVKIIFRKTERRQAIHSRHHQPSLMKTNCLPVSLFWIKQVKASKKKKKNSMRRGTSKYMSLFCLLVTLYKMNLDSMKAVMSSMIYY